MFSNSPFYRAFKTLGNEAVVLVLAMVVLNIFLSSTGLAVENCGPAYGEGFHGRVIISEGSDKVEKIYFERSSWSATRRYLRLLTTISKELRKRGNSMLRCQLLQGRKRLVDDLSKVVHYKRY